MKATKSLRDRCSTANDDAAELRKFVDKDGNLVYPNATAFGTVYAKRCEGAVRFTEDPRDYGERATKAARARGDIGEVAVVRFTNDDGTLCDSKEMRATDPLAYAAYILWPADPAVQAAINAGAADSADSGKCFGG